jgi:leucyl aminopeptidase
MALISDHTNYEQNIFTASLIDEYLKINWTWDKCDYACSDHSAWNHEGYPASFAIEAILKEENPFIHTPQDTFDKSFNNTNHAANFTKLGLAYLLELDL